MGVDSTSEAVPLTSVDKFVRGLKGEVEQKNGKIGLSDLTKLYFSVGQIDREVVGGNWNTAIALADLLEVVDHNTQAYGWINKIAGRFVDVSGGESGGKMAYMVRLATNGDSDVKDRGEWWVNSHVDEAVKWETFGDTQLKIFNYSVSQASREGVVGDKWREYVVDKLTDNKYREVFINEVVPNLKYDRAGCGERLKVLVESFGIEKKMANDVVNSWLTFKYESIDNDSEAERRWIEIMINNFKQMKAIRDGVGRDGLVKLYDDYGITHFGRYQSEWLIDQIENEDSGLPYGVVLSAYSDVNGALMQSLSVKVRSQLIESAKELGYRTIFVEARSKPTVVRRIQWLALKNPNQKIAFRWIDGHGNPVSVQLGEINSDYYQLSAEDLKKKTAQKMKQYYSENCPTIFDACSTGLGIGPEYSRYGDGYSMAPDRPGNLKKVTLKKDSEGKLFFDGDYSSTDNNKTGAVLSFKGESAKKRIAEENRKLTEQTRKGLLGDQKFMYDVWNDYNYNSLLLDLLSAQALKPLKEVLRDHYGNVDVLLDFGIKWLDGQVEVIPDHFKDIGLEDKGDELITFSAGIDEGFGRLAKYAYSFGEDKRNRMVVFARVQADRKIEDFEVDLRNLYPENIKDKS